MAEPAGAHLEFRVLGPVQVAGRVWHRRAGVGQAGRAACLPAGRPRRGRVARPADRRAVGRAAARGGRERPAGARARAAPAAGPRADRTGGARVPAAPGVRRAGSRALRAPGRARPVRAGRRGGRRGGVEPPRGARAVARAGLRGRALRGVRAGRGERGWRSCGWRRSRTGSRPTSRSGAIASSSPSSRRWSPSTRAASGSAGS